MKNRDYWAKRFEDLESQLLKIGENESKELIKEYAQATANIKKDISVWYMRIAKNEGISLSEAKRKLDMKELKEFKWQVDDYLKAAKENNLDGRWIKELENASARVHIEKLKVLEIQIKQQVELLYNGQNKRFYSFGEEIYQEGYYRSIYEVQRGYGFGSSFAILETDSIRRAISKPWAADGLVFSDRLWSNKAKLGAVLQKEVTQAFIRGDSLEDLVSTVEKQMNASRSNTLRLVATESSFFSSAGRLQAYNELDLDQYEVVATLDMVTSDICQSMDGKIFETKDFKAGTTANPFHVNCRSTTAPYFADNYGEIGERAARGKDGKTYYVPENIKYHEWLKKYAGK